MRSNMEKLAGVIDNIDFEKDKRRNESDVFQIFEGIRTD